MICVTNYLTSAVDPQRGKKWLPDPSAVDELAESLPCDLVVLSDEVPPQRKGNVEWVKVKPYPQPYFARWFNTYAWVRDNPTDQFVWSLDATDVVMLRQPEPEPGVLYIGANRSTLGTNSWLKAHHRHPKSLQAVRDHRLRTFVNTGVLGGDHATMVEFLEDLASELPREGDLTEMGAVEDVCWNRWAKRMEFGPHVHTIFKAYEDNGTAWWKHK